MTQPAFLGLGAIGLPMARRLAAAHPTTRLWNRTASRAAALAAEGSGTAVGTPAEAARGADVVFTCLPTSREVAALLDGEDGLLAGLGEGATLVDCTSGDPATSRDIAARLAAVGVAFVDAPVSGGTSGAAAGTLTIMCGGEARDLDRVRPLLETMGRRIVHAGPVGAGHALKAVNNALLGMHLWGAAEGLAALAKAGVRPELALEVINASSGRANATETLFPERVLTGTFPRTFRAALLDKDVGIAADLARAQRVPSPLLQLTAELWRLAHVELGEEADHVEVVKVVERMAGVLLRSADAENGTTGANGATPTETAR